MKIPRKWKGIGLRNLLKFDNNGNLINTPEEIEKIRKGIQTRYYHDTEIIQKLKQKPLDKPKLKNNGIKSPQINLSDQPQT